MFHAFAFVQAASPSLSHRSSWTPKLNLSSRRRPITANSPVMRLSRHIPIYRPNHQPSKTVNNGSALVALPILPSVPTVPTSFNDPVTHSSLNVLRPTSLLSHLASPLVRPARTALAFSARVAKRLHTMRRRHRLALGLARMTATLSLAAVSYFVTRSALPLATITAPTLPNMPQLPFRLPPALAETMKPFTESFGVVFLSEFGDKSMFATALMAMKHSPLIVCIGALAALTVMTFIACFLGQLMHYLPATVTHYSSIALFVFFGVQMILQSRHLPNVPGGSGGERADAEEMVAEASVAQVQSPLTVLAKVSSLIFVAEWCDRSMLATMALAASSNTVAVIGGATLANVVCTGFAVCAATLVASRISERLVALVAGILFEVFAVFTYLEGPEG